MELISGNNSRTSALNGELEMSLIIFVDVLGFCQV